MGDAAAVPSAPRTGWRARPWWPWAKRLLTWTFLAVVAWLIVRYARDVDWDDVADAVRALPPASVAIAVALAACSHALYSTFDLLGRRMTGHRLGTGTVMGITFVAYAFNLNLGAIVGSIALRFRLYARMGLDNATVTRVMAFSMLTNWLGYLVIAGLAFCAAAGERTWHLGRHALETPSWRMALLQLAMSIANWSLMAAIVWTLLSGQVAYLHVLAVLLVAAVAGLVSHVPAGLGVLEAVFVALLSHEVSQGRLIAALLAYRAVYYLLPLAVAAVFYVVTEWRARRMRR